MRLNLRIKGRVQGVGFRHFVNQTARKLSLTGWVRNLEDGDVEAEAQGDETILNQFIHTLKQGHPWARVDSIQSQKLQENRHENNFEVEP